MCTNPNGCDCMDHNNSCFGCYWYRNTNEKDNSSEERGN